MDQVAQVRGKTDIVSLIQSYVPLKKTGANFKAPCPFHNEKTPSFVVSPERQIWHCFGCSRGGDCFTFLMEYEHMEFPEALRVLADKAGVHLVQKNFDPQSQSKKERIYKINSLAADYYHYILTKHAVGKQALDYLLKERKILPQTVGTYMLGFSPGSGNSLTEYLLKKKNYTKEDILDAGLGSLFHGRLIDFFQGRLMFPLYDHRGNVIGFSGRVLKEGGFGGKYINTRETLVYHKGSVFFGLNQSKEAIKKAEKAIIMEGEFDVIAAFQEGITNTVAVKGTALTEEQVRLLSRFAKVVSLCFDMDRPGQEATKRSLPVLEKLGITIMAVTIPGGKDPDEAIKEDPIAFKKAIKQDRPVYDVLLERLLKTNDLQSIQGKKQIGGEMLSFISHMNNEIVREHYLRLLEKSIHTSYESLNRELSKIAKEEIVKKVAIAQTEKKSKEELLEDRFCALLFQFSKVGTFIKEIVFFLQTYKYEWIKPAREKLILKLEEYCKANKEFDQKKFITLIPSELLPTFDESFLFPLLPFATQEAYSEDVKKTLEDMVKLFLKNQITKITLHLEKFEKEQNEQEITRLQEQYGWLLAKRGQLEKSGFSFERKSGII